MASQGTTSGFDGLDSGKIQNRSQTKQDKVPSPEADEKTWGRTSSGQVFEVPQTCDMLHTLLDPRLRKTLADMVTVAILVSYVFLYFWLPQRFRTPVFFVLFGIWRAAYNGGIGYLLKNQSEHRMITAWTAKYKVLEPSDWWVHRLVMQDLRARLSVDTDEEVHKVPSEFKSWILFRHFVDLVLMSDFVTYVLLSCSVLHSTNHSYLVTFGRWAAGLTLLVFNLWVKIDAHRVVKDYAWYWGDFFFLQDVNLTFDGVFELAPHPMYSIGYAAYYGVSLMTSSMTLFVASVLAHAAQFWFLIAVENPHIEKTYNTAGSPPVSVPSSLERPAPKAMLGLRNFNFTRSSDVVLMALVLTTSLFYFASASVLSTTITFALAISWRLLHTLGLGVLLRRQSESKTWTKLFLKYGLTAADAYQQWQVIYNVTTVMSYVSLGVVFLREWTSPLEVSYWPFRYIVGAMLIALQMWTSYSIFDSLDEYGWFYGDFFYIRDGHQLTYSGIYRYLNHPERLAGIAGVWGLALICCSSPVTLLAFMWSFCNLGFIQFVEKPHMRKLYGEQNVERDSGVSKNLRKPVQLLPKEYVDVEAVTAQLEQLWDTVVLSRIEQMETLRPRVKGVVSDTRNILKQTPARMTNIMSDDKVPPREGYSLCSEKKEYYYGEPISVKWKAGKGIDPKDWIGLYRAGENDSKTITNVSSSGRWAGINKTGFPNHHPDAAIETLDQSGTVKFTGKLLFWQPGTYELRYHYKGKHNVLAVSEPFEIVVKTHQVVGPVSTLAEKLIELNSTFAGTPLKELQLNDNEILARMTDGIRRIFGIDLAPFVIQADGTAERVAERLLDVDHTLKQLSFRDN